MLPPGALKIPMPSETQIAAFEAEAAQRGQPVVTKAGPETKPVGDHEPTLMLPPGSLNIPMPSASAITAMEVELSGKEALQALIPPTAPPRPEDPNDPPGAKPEKLDELPPKVDPKIQAALMAADPAPATEPEPAPAAPVPATKPDLVDEKTLVAETKPVDPPAINRTECVEAKPVIAEVLSPEEELLPPAHKPLPANSGKSAHHGGNGAHASAAARMAPTSPSRSAFLPPPDSPFAPQPETLPLPPETSIIGLPSASSYQLRRVMAAPPKPPPEPLLQAQGLKKSFGKREVVRGVDINVGPGEIVGLLGRNGAGKTTTFRMIMGMLQPDTGNVRFDNREITRLPMYARANRGLGYLAQEPSVFQKLSVEENLLAVLELQISTRATRLKKLDELIHMLGLETVRRGRASTLSGGERRRLEIARAMTLNPKIVLFDEPFAGIDPIAVNEIQNILRDLKRANVGVLLTDHNVRETLNITDRTYIMDEGVIWIHGSPREIVNHPEARKRYLGHEFRLDF